MRTNQREIVSSADDRGEIKYCHLQKILEQRTGAVSAAPVMTSATITS